MKNRRSFNYYVPTYEDAHKIVEESTKGFDSIYKRDTAKDFKPKQGINYFRILPPTWDNARHFAYIVKLHNNIGVNSSGQGTTYLCPKHNELSPYKECPVCDEIEDMTRKGFGRDLTKNIRLSDGAIIYLIARHAEDEGVLRWKISMSSNAEIIAQATDNKRRRYINITHPLEGYDIEVTRIGKGFPGTSYKGWKIDRQPSPIVPIVENTDKLDEILDYIEANPIPTILQFYDPEHIAKKFLGKSETDEEEERNQSDSIEEPNDRSGRRMIPVVRDDPPFETASEPSETGSIEPMRSRRRQSLPDDEVPLESAENGSLHEQPEDIQAEIIPPEKTENSNPSQYSEMKARLMQRLQKGNN